MFLNLSFEGRIYMSQTGTPTEFLQLGITEPDDTLNVLVDLNGQWQKIDTGVKNVDTKANTNASGISALNTAVQDNTENITNILETNVNQQNSIDTLQSKVATLEEDDTSYGSRITAVEAGVQENSELINDLEVDLSGVKTDMGTVPSGSTLQGQVDGLDTRVTTLENSGSVSALETRVTTLETEVGTVPSGETVQGQITTLNGQVNSGNIPFRFSVDGGGNYGYLKADDSFVPFRSGSGDTHWHELDTSLYIGNYVADYNHSFIVPYVGWRTSDSPYYGKLHDLIHDIDYTLPTVSSVWIVGCTIIKNGGSYIANNGTLTAINDKVYGVVYSLSNYYTRYLTKNGNALQEVTLDADGNSVGVPVNYTLHGTPTGTIYYGIGSITYIYNNTKYYVTFDNNTGTANESISTSTSVAQPTNYIGVDTNQIYDARYFIDGEDHTEQWSTLTNTVSFNLPSFLINRNSKWLYYI